MKFHRKSVDFHEIPKRGSMEFQENPSESRGISRKSIEIHGIDGISSKIHGISRDSIGNPRISWKSIANLWDLMKMHRESMGSHANPLKFHVMSWKSNENPWDFVKIHRESMGFRESPSAIHGISRNPIGSPSKIRGIS